VARLINAAMPKEIEFTSGGTESINHAIKEVAPANAEKVNTLSLPTLS
jgi:cysteine sulfinate desulfinase/cysteine desulfurase-like protein